MSQEYQLSYTAEQIDEKLGKVDNAVGWSDLSHFGIPYSNATAIIDFSNSVKMYLFATPNGYDAEVVGNGKIPDQTFVDASQKTYRTDSREYSAERINRLHIGGGVTEVGNYFMYRAYSLQSLTFANSKAITRIGTRAFGYTSISGEYDFSGITDTILDAPFIHCHKLDGLTFNNTATEITEKAFQMCLSLRSVKGLSNINKIGNAAFQYCVNLRSIDVLPRNVTLGDWVFILTPIDAKVGESPLSDAIWKGMGDLCFAHTEWTVDQLEAIRAVQGKSMQMPIPESDNQGTEFYNHWGLFPFVYDGAYKGYTHHASKCCGIFSLYHIYNILHPNSQYDTFYDWMMRGVVPNKIKVTQSLHDTLANCENGQLLIQGNTAVSYEVGSEITARDLPMALDDNTETWGEEGTSAWGVCTALGWTATEMLFDDGADSGAKVKQAILDSLADNKPVMMEIVGAGKHEDVSGHGMHAVVAIGYDADTKRLLIIDSTGGFDADVVPLTYWCKFESLITPHSWSAIWTFDFGEVVSMTDIDNKLDTLLSTVNSGFHPANGTVKIPSDIKGANSTATVTYTIPCPPNAKIVMFEADEDTLTAIKSTSNWLYTTGLHVNFADELSASEKNTFTSNWNKTSMAYGGAGATMSEEGCTVECFAILAGTYRWKAYYWNE